MGKRGQQGPPRRPPDDGRPSRGGGGVGKPAFPVHEHVGRRLREMFDEVTTQPIPDKFVTLLEELEQRQSVRPPSDAKTSDAPKRKPKRKPRKAK